MEQMKKLLLHTCCAPCVTVPLERLSESFNVTCYFYNPNIHPKREYRQRLEELKGLLEDLNVDLVIGEYDVKQWFDAVKGLEHEPEGGKRCEVCFRFRLERTAKIAAERGFDCFTTVMSISPHKNAKLLNEIGNELSREYGVEYIEANFKKKDGFKRSVELSRKYNLYRQDYCGCIFSKKEREAKK